jgi:hypothetical protein
MSDLKVRPHKEWLADSPRPPKERRNKGTVVFEPTMRLGVGGAARTKISVPPKAQIPQPQKARDDGSGR